MDKEQKWLQKRLGMITASELGQITSASGKIIDGNLSYIRAKRWERKHGFTHPITARAMEIGNEQEPMIYQWALENLGLKHGGFDSIVYSRTSPKYLFGLQKTALLGPAQMLLRLMKALSLNLKLLSVHRRLNSSAMNIPPTRRRSWQYGRTMGISFWDSSFRIRLLKRYGL